MSLLSLGNSQIDDILGGGIDEGACTILVGQPGSGKTTLALQFISNPLALTRGGKAAYLCIDKRPECILEKAISLNPIVNDHIANGCLKFLEISIQDWEPDQPVNDLLLSIQLQVDAFYRNFNPNRIIIDSLLPHALACCSREKKQYFIREFLQIIHAYPITSIGLLYDHQVFRSLWLDIHIVSDQLIFKSTFEHDYVTYWLDVSKNKPSNRSGTYRFTFNSQKGIELKHRLC